MLTDRILSRTAVTPRRTAVAAMALTGLLALVVATARAGDLPAFSRGRGVVQVPRLHECAGGRLTPLGTVRSSDGRQWTVPAANHWQQGPRAADLYNECNGVRPGNFAQADLATVPVVEVDADGEVVTGYLMADNYFELHVNGKLIGVDAVPFTPFNSAVVRFRVKRPYTLAVQLVDWEENLGLGTEAGNGGPHPGDGGFIARFSDGTVTDGSWKAQSFYIAPLGSPAEVIERGNVHDTSALGRSYPQAPALAACGEDCYAAHYPLPERWQLPRFNDTLWPAAELYTHAEMGLGQPAYRNVSEAFGDARVIWSRNLVLDNLVLVRKRVR